MLSPVSPLFPEETTRVPFQRDSRGLIVGETYPLTEKGLIDWRAKVDTRFLYVARQYEEAVIKEQKVPLDKIDLLAVRDDWLRIKVGGINQLAWLRGYTSLEYEFTHVSDTKASCVCRMEFTPNFETNMLPFVCSASASATIRSVDKQFIPFLETFAENRSLVRCVKRALQINILSDIEVGGESKKAAEGGDSEESSSPRVHPIAEPEETRSWFNPCEQLRVKCYNPPAPLKTLPFDILKAYAVKYQQELPEDAVARLKGDPSKWTDWSSILGIDAWLLIGQIDEWAKDKKAGRGWWKSKG